MYSKSPRLPMVMGVIFFCAAATRADSAGLLRGRVAAFSLSSRIVRPSGRNRRSRKSREVLVYTPPGYDDRANANRRYPVLYLLHGTPGNPWNFIRYGRWPDLLEREAQSGGLPPALLVIPDGNYAGEKHGDSEWVNAADGRDRFEDFVVNEVVPWADTHYRTRATRQDRTIGGVSEGGYGAVNVALHHPQVFGGVLALSGYYDNDGSGWARPIMGRAPAFLRANSPLQYVDVGAGRVPSGWKTMRIFLGAGAGEKRYESETRALAGKLSVDGIPVTLRVLKGKHGWGLWDELFREGIRILLSSRPA